MEKNFTEKFEQARTVAINHIEPLMATPEYAEAVIKYYLLLQIFAAEKDMAVEERIPIKKQKVLATMAIVFAEVAEESLEMMIDQVGSDEQSDFTYTFAYPLIANVIENFNKQLDADEKIDLENEQLFKCIMASFGAALRIAYEKLSTDTLFDYLKHDQPDAFTLNVTDPRQTYDWVQQVFGMECTDFLALERMFKDTDACQSEETKQEAEQMLGDMKNMVKILLPMLCADHVLENCSKTEEMLIKDCIDIMLQKDEHVDYLGKLFALGISYVAMMPKSVNLKEGMSKPGECDKWFDAFMDGMGGVALKQYMQGLDKIQQKVARLAWVGGLGMAVASTQADSEGCGLFGVKQGMAYQY